MAENLVESFSLQLIAQMSLLHRYFSYLAVLCSFELK